MKKSVSKKRSPKVTPKTKKKSTGTIKSVKSKPKVAFYWCSSCGGCEETIIDFDEKLLDIVGLIDIVFWPCAMDFKTSDLRQHPDKSITVAFINGAIRTSEQESMAKLLRQKAQLVIAFGMCAYQGGIPALANLTNKQAILNRAYCAPECADNPDQTLPQEHTKINDIELTLPNFYETVLKLNDVIDVDYYLPGCPPTVPIIEKALGAILAGKLPPTGAVLAPNQSLCNSCTRNETKPDNLTLNKINRVHEVILDSTRCFLAQGVLCLGPATRDGCEQLCINGNMPCSGCFGPLEHSDQGAKLIAAIGGFYEGDSEEAAQTLAESIPDPAGTFYRYGLSASLLGKKRSPKKEES